MTARLLPLLFRKRNQLPVYLIHSVTERCNADCKHCFVQKNKHKKELQLDEIERFCDQAGPNLYHVCLSGGEPFLRNDLADIALAYFERTSVRSIRISTNGFFVDRAVQTASQIVDRIRGRRQLVIELSLDGVGKDHDDIRKIPGLFERTVECYRKLSELQRRYSRLGVNVNVTICRSNQGKLDELYEYLRRELGVQNISLTLTRGSASISNELDVDIGVYERFTRRIERDLSTSRLPGYGGSLNGYLVNAQNILARRRIVETVRSNQFISRCYAGALAGVLLSDGRVMACEIRPDVFGNIRERTFQEIWMSRTAKDFRKSCDTCRCTHECFLAPTIVFNPQYAPRLSFMAGQMWLANFWRRSSRHFEIP